MQRPFASRLAWRNLKIRAKVGIIIGLVLVLILIFTVINVLQLGQLSAQTRTSVDQAVQVRSQAQDVQLSVDSLQRVQTRLMDDFNQQGFDPVNTPLRQQFYDEAASVLDEELPALKELALSQVTDPQQREDITADFTNFENALRESVASFDRVIGIVEDLSDPALGTFFLLGSNGDVFESLTLQTQQPELLAQIVVIRSLEDSLIQTGELATKNDLRQALNEYRILYQGSTPLAEQNPTVFSALERHLDLTDQLYNQYYELNLVNRTGTVNLGRARDAAARIATIANERAEAQANVAQAETSRVQTFLLIGFAVQVVGIAVVLLLFGRDIAVSLRRLLQTAQRFEEGDLQVRSQVPGEDEFAELGRTFNSMAGQLGELVGGLEARVAERTRDLVITAEIGEAVVAHRDPRELMQEVVDLVRERFDFYHVQVFLVDDAVENAVLVASTGTAGRALLARRHSLPVGSQSVIGQVTGRGEAVIALDTDTSAVHRRNELLPDTRSEMALPMRVGGQIIGALDVQSVLPNAYDQDTVAVFQIMADQLAIALENARLRARYEDAIVEIQAMERRITAEAWKSFQSGRDPNAPLGYELQGKAVAPYREEMPTALQQAMQSGTPVSLQSNGDVELALPIKVRGEVIGAFGFSGQDLANMSGEDIALIEAVIDRVGMALENMRLVEQTARRAEYEQIVNEITAKIVGSTDVNFILQTTVKELGRALRAPQTSVQLRRESTGMRHEQQ